MSRGEFSWLPSEWVFGYMIADIGPNKSAWNSALSFYEQAILAKEMVEQERLRTSGPLNSEKFPV